MSVARYSIVRYLPDPLREEYINIGVIVLTDDGQYAGCRFTDNWRRAYVFGRQDTSFLTHFAEYMQRSVNPQLRLYETCKLGMANLREMISDWANSIQLTELRATVDEDPVELLNDLFTMYVVDWKSKSSSRSKQQLVQAAQSSIATTLEMNFAPAKLRVEQSGHVRGDFEEHRFDLVISNGKALIGLDAFSFERASSSELNHAIDAVAYSIIDVKARQSDFPLGILIAPPLKARSDYERAKALYERLGAAILSEDRLIRWVSNTIPTVLHAGFPD